MNSKTAISDFSLWNHQREAVARMQDYIAKYHSGEVTGSALVHMPTGSGKTGVIATLSQCIPDIDCVLVLTPRIALREQLVRDIQGRFFEHLRNGPDPDQLPKTVVELVGDNLDIEGLDMSNTIAVSTIQKIQRLSKRNEPLFRHLKQHVSLVLFDEGHYEPARTWGEAIRQLEAPRIVFTATPYRNDLRVFDLEIQHIYSYTYHEAVEDGYLREVEIVPRPEAQQPEQFVEDVLRFYDGNLGKALNSDSRVIIRAESRAAIRQIATALRRHDRGYLALHETFSDRNGDPRERKTVPDPQTEDATFWVHQFKLLEGIDDSRFQLLAIFDPFSTARPLVQQIGRIIRNPGHDKQARGYVLDHSGGRQAELWEGYLSYDAAIGQQDELALAMGDSWLLRLLESQPGTMYLQGRFRSQLDLDKLVPDSGILVPRTVNLLQTLEDFDIEDFCGRLLADYENDDRIVRLWKEDQKTAVLVYIAFPQSRYLKSAYFIEPKLGVTIIHEVGNLLAFYDSQGYVPVNHGELGVGKAVPSSILRNLFQDDPTTFLTHVSLRNTNLGARSIRTRSLGAAVMRETVAAFDDHAQICTTARGYSPDGGESPNDQIVRRYVGFSRGRVSDSSGRWCSLDGYIDWIHEIVRLTAQGGASLATFHRYAPTHVEIDDPTPIHILLDLFEVEHKYVTLATDQVAGGQELNVEDRACEVEDGQFQVRANGTLCEVSIKFDAGRNKYELASADLDCLYRSTEAGQHRGLVDYLNRTQSFRAIPSAGNVIYVLGEFYRPIYKVGSEFKPERFEVGKTLIPSPELEIIGSEKTPALSDGTGWDCSTLFGVVDRLGKTANLDHYFGDPDILICDDMGTEIADFILADTENNRVVFIHAKASSTKRPYSASALQDVCAQATKNINYLGMFDEEVPPGLNSWNGPWRSGGAQVTDRRRRGDMDSTDLWAGIRSITRHPLAEREVWLFLGQMLSKHQLEEHLAKEPPTAEALQAAFLLHATMTSVASVGAKMRVFCYP